MKPWFHELHKAAAADAPPPPPPPPSCWLKGKLGGCSSRDSTASHYSALKASSSLFGPVAFWSVVRSGPKPLAIRIINAQLWIFSDIPASSLSHACHLSLECRNCHLELSRTWAPPKSPHALANNYRLEIGGRREGEPNRYSLAFFALPCLFAICRVPHFTLKWDGHSMIPMWHFLANG